MSSTTLLENWTQPQFGTLEQGVLLARHRLLETGLFDDERLVELLDTHPADCLQINTMGENEGVLEWQEGDRNGVDGATLLETVERGRLWINIRNMLDHHPQYAKVIHQLYDELEAGNPKFRAHHRSANLLLSSPHALVYYHMDIPVNMLWHLRGRKRVWVYPHFDERFVARDILELVCSGEYTEDIPYDPEMDRFALTFDAQPGELITWPQHTPHRVTNLDGLNVSLSTEHRNPTATRRNNVIMANRWLRANFNCDCRDFGPDGIAAHAKQFLMRLVRLTRRFNGYQPPRKIVYPVTFQVDPAAPLGVAPMERERDSAETQPSVAV